MTVAVRLVGTTSERPARQKRRRLWLMVCVAVVMGFVGFCYIYLTPEKLSHREWEARRWVESVGGTVRTEYQSAGGIVGHRVNLSGTGITDDDLCRLLPLGPRIIYLDLSRTQVNGSRMPVLTDLADGHRCYSQVLLGGTRITDGSLCRIVKGADLSYLDVSNTEITDAGVAGLLSTVENVLSLNLSYTKVTRASILPLRRSKQLLRDIWMRGLPLTDQDIPMLVELVDKYLLLLDVTDTKLSQDGIEMLRAQGKYATQIDFGNEQAGLREIPSFMPPGVDKWCR